VERRSEDGEEEKAKKSIFSPLYILLSFFWGVEGRGLNGMSVKGR
jgi:hypothetical protein